MPTFPDWWPTALDPTTQEGKPIVFILWGGGIPLVVPFAIPYVGIIRPQSIRIHRPTRGTTYQTATSAFVDHYGEGLPQLMVTGHTGWKGSAVSGIVGFKLIEALFVEWNRRLLRVADPTMVHLWYLDALMMEAFEVYLNDWQADKAAAQSQLYNYTLRASVTSDLLQDAIYGFLDDFLSLAGPLVDSAFSAVGDLFSAADVVGAVA